jgi:hypothetical protein
MCTYTCFQFFGQTVLSPLSSSVRCVVCIVQKSPSLFQFRKKLITWSVFNAFPLFLSHFVPYMILLDCTMSVVFPHAFVFFLHHFSFRPNRLFAASSKFKRKKLDYSLSFQCFAFLFVSSCSLHDTLGLSHVCCARTLFCLVFTSLFRSPKPLMRCELEKRHDKC